MGDWMGDWFAEAAEGVSKTERAKEIATRAEAARLERERLEREARNKNPAIVAAARGQFDAVAAGLAPPHAPGYARGGYVPPPANPRSPRPGSAERVERAAKTDPNAAMAVILRQVRMSPDPAAAASMWLTALTTELTKIVRETQDEE